MNIADGVLRIRTRKTGATLTIPLHPELTDWLQKQPRGIAKAPIFASLVGKGTGGRHGLSGLFKTIMEKAEIKGRALRSADTESRGRNTSSLSFHSLRHSFVSALANAGVTAEIRQKLSGHADERSHSTYTHHELDQLRDAVGKLPSIAVDRVSN